MISKYLLYNKHMRLLRIFLIASLLLGVIGYAVAPGFLIATDHTIAFALFSVRTPLLLKFFSAITLLGSAEVLAIAVLFLTLLLWNRKQKHFILTLWLTLFTGETAMLLGKILFRRVRPEILLQATAETTYSFPSGHATTAVAFFGFLAYLLIRTQKNRSVKIHVFVLAILVITLLDLSRLYLGVHYLSDVLAGNLVGLAALLFSISVTERLIRKKNILLSTLPLFDIVVLLLAELFLVFLLVFVS